MSEQSRGAKVQMQDRTVQADMAQSQSQQQQLLRIVFCPQALLTLLLCFLCFLLLRSRRYRYYHKQRQRQLPPSPRGRLPIIGHLHLVSPGAPHVSLAELSREHAEPGGLLLLDLGHARTLVVSSPRAAEAVLRAHDHAMASRPPSAAADVLFSGSSDVAFAPYGEHWRQARRLLAAHLLSAGKVRALRGAREDEAGLALARARRAAARGQAVDVTGLLGAYANDVVCRAVSGKFSREEEGRRNELLRELVAGHVAALAGFGLEDFFPGLGKARLLRRLVLAKTIRLKRRWDELLDEIIDDHAARLSSSSSSSSSQGQGRHDNRPRDDGKEDREKDFVDVLLSLQHEYGLTRDNVKAILIDMFAAGTDTSHIVMDFAMAELMRKPRVMAKLQAEVRSKTPEAQETVKEEDLSGMAYLKAVVKETLRLHPPVPILLPRFSMTSRDDVNGYVVPAGTRVVVNAWALGRDVRSWGEDAEEFSPERFMVDGDGGADYKGRDFQFLPFGAGRRICPGVSFGVVSVEIMLANLVYCFDWELPIGMREEDVDMADVFGLTMRRKEKLLLVPTIPRMRSCANGSGHL